MTTDQLKQRNGNDQPSLISWTCDHELQGYIDKLANTWIFLSYDWSVDDDALLSLVESDTRVLERTYLLWHN